MESKLCKQKKLKHKTQSIRKGHKKADAWIYLAHSAVGNLFAEGNPCHFAGLQRSYQLLQNNRGQVRSGSLNLRLRRLLVVARSAGRGTAAGHYALGGGLRMLAALQDVGHSVVVEGGRRCRWGILPALAEHLECAQEPLGLVHRYPGQPVEDEPDEHGGGIVQLTNLRLANCKTERL